jgi:hypothetical protein
MGKRRRMRKSNFKLRIMAKKRIRSVEQLDREIYRHQLRVKEMEYEFDRSIDHLKHHFPSMVVRSVLGRSKPVSAMGITGDVALRLMESEQLQDGFLSLIDKLSERIGRMFRRRRSEEPAEPVEPKASDVE